MHVHVTMVMHVLALHHSFCFQTMSSQSARAYADLVARVHVATLEQAYVLYHTSPDVEYCIPILVTHVVAKVLEAEVAFSPRYTRTAVAKNAKPSTKFGCSMVVAMDMAGVAVALMFAGDGHFGTIATRVSNRVQPGYAYIVYPARLGKLWKNGGIEILDIEAEDSLRALPNNVSIWEFFGVAARSTLPERAEFTTAYITRCTVRYLLRADTSFYTGCGNANCQSLIRLAEGTCPHCPTEGARKRWMCQFSLEVALEDTDRGCSKTDTPLGKN